VPLAKVQAAVCGEWCDMIVNGDYISHSCHAQCSRTAAMRCAVFVILFGSQTCMTVTVMGHLTLLWTVTPIAISHDMFYNKNRMV